MIRDYIIGPSMYPYGCFDIRFAEKYGIEEAIVFNTLAREIMLTEQTDESRRCWGGVSDCMEDGGIFWVRVTEKFLFRGNSKLFSETKAKEIVKNLEDFGLLFVRASLTKGYFWIALGEEKE